MEATRWQEVSSELEWKSSDCGGCCLLPLSVKLIREMFMNQPSTIFCSAAPSFWWMYICRPAELQLSRDMCVGDQKDVYVRAPGWPTGAIGGLDKYNNTPLPRNWADDLVANHLSR